MRNAATTWTGAPRTKPPARAPNRRGGPRDHPPLRPHWAAGLRHLRRRHLDRGRVRRPRSGHLARAPEGNDPVDGDEARLELTEVTAPMGAAMTSARDDANAGGSERTRCDPGARAATLQPLTDGTQGRWAAQGTTRPPCQNRTSPSFVLSSTRSTRRTGNGSLDSSPATSSATARPRESQGSTRRRNSWRSCGPSSPPSPMPLRRCSTSWRRATRWRPGITFEVRSLGPMGNFPPRGKVLEATYLAIHRLEDQRIAEAWAEWDNLAGLKQLGHLGARSGI